MGAEFSFNSVHEITCAGMASIIKVIGKAVSMWKKLKIYYKKDGIIPNVTVKIVISTPIKRFHMEMKRMQ